MANRGTDCKLSDKNRADTNSNAFGVREKTLQITPRLRIGACHRGS